jgi:hypothetical protein
LVVAFVGSDYQSSDWCGLEWQAMLDLHEGGDGVWVMLFRMDNGDVSGLG